LSKVLMNFLWREARLPIIGRATCPSTKGRSKSVAMLSMACPSDSPPVAPPSMASPMMAGVSTMPSRLDSVALNIAAGTLPLAMAVMATDEEMVDGKAHK